MVGVAICIINVVMLGEQRPRPIVAYPAGCVPVLVIHCDRACRRCSGP